MVYPNLKIKNYNLKIDSSKRGSVGKTLYTKSDFGKIITQTVRKIIIKSTYSERLLKYHFSNSPL